MAVPFTVDASVRAAAISGTWTDPGPGTTSGLRYRRVWDTKQALPLFDLGRVVAESQREAAAREAGHAPGAPIPGSSIVRAPIPDIPPMTPENDDPTALPHYSRVLLPSEVRLALQKADFWALLTQASPALTAEERALFPAAGAGPTAPASADDYSGRAHAEELAGDDGSGGEDEDGESAPTSRAASGGNAPDSSHATHAHAGATPAAARKVAGRNAGRTGPPLPRFEPENHTVRVPWLPTHSFWAGDFDMATNRPGKLNQIRERLYLVFSPPTAGAAAAGGDDDAGYACPLWGVGRNRLGCFELHGTLDVRTLQFHAVKLYIAAPVVPQRKRKPQVPKSPAVALDTDDSASRRSSVRKRITNRLFDDTVDPSEVTTLSSVVPKGAAMAAASRASSAAARADKRRREPELSAPRTAEKRPRPAAPPPLAEPTELARAVARALVRDAALASVHGLDNSPALSALLSKPAQELAQVAAGAEASAAPEAAAAAVAPAPPAAQQSEQGTAAAAAATPANEPATAQDSPAAAGWTYPPVGSPTLQRIIDAAVASDSPVWVPAHRLGEEAGPCAGDVYEGEMLQGKPHGWGTAIYRSGFMYEGYWHTGVEHGWGVLSTEQDDVVYRGEVSLGVPHGRGVAALGDAVHFSGELRDGLPHGRGLLTAAGQGEFDGGWECGVWHGPGRAVYANEAVYDGDWVAGERVGRGVLACPSGFSYDGQWAAGVPHGRGTAAYPSGTTYAGTWAYGQRNQRGELRFPNGATLKSRWTQDKMASAGTLELGSPVALSEDEVWLPLQLTEAEMKYVHIRAGFYEAKPAT